MDIPGYRSHYALIRRFKAADGYRTMRWRTALAKLKRFAHTPCLYANWFAIPRIVVQDIDVANVNQADLIVAAALAAAATAVIPASGYEIEYLIKQFDWVSEIGHILHVGLLSIFNGGQDVCCNCFHVVTSCKTPIWMHCRTNCFCGNARRSFYCHASLGAAELDAANILMTRREGRSSLAVDLRRRHNIVLLEASALQRPLAAPACSASSSPIRWFHSSRDGCATR